MRKKNRQLILLVLLITLLAAAIRIYHLGGDSLWFDEVATSQTAHQPLLAAYERDHPPLLYWLVKASIILLGESEWSLRLPSMLAGVTAVPLLFLLGYVSHKSTVGLWASFLLALSPFHLRYAQEARHYSLLTCFSLLSTLCLYLALTRRQYRWWLLFGLSTALNLYTHYGAFLVLATHLAVMGGWLIMRRYQNRPLFFWQPVAAGLVIFLLYLPWLFNFQTAIVSNVGETAVASTGMAPVILWLSAAYTAFGFQHQVLAALTLLLAVAGLVSWSQQRRWLLLAIILSLLTVPFLLITGLQIARWSLPKYIIYMLPAYLLAAAAGLAMVLPKLSAIYPGKQSMLTGLVALLILLATIPQVQAEHEFVERDWRGAIAYTAARGEASDIFIVYTLDLPDGFNQGGIAAPYYLDRAFADYIILDGYRLTPQQLEQLPEQRRVWLFVLDRLPPPLIATPETAIAQFDGSLFVLSQPVPDPSPIKQIETMLADMLPAVRHPAPYCLLQRELAGVYLAGGDVVLAAATFDQATQTCPTPPDNQHFWSDMSLNIDRALLDAYVRSGDYLQAAAIAQTILQLDRKDEDALAAITAVNLLDLYKASAPGILIADGDAPEPIQIQHYTMPQDGDWGEVLFMHPPASISFRLALPDNPVTLHSRLALAPESWAWGGDGVTFIVTGQLNEVATDESAAIDLFQQHIANIPDNHRWHDMSVPLADYAGQTITLTLTTDVGPAGDSTGDWAGWETPRLIWQP